MSKLLLWATTTSGLVKETIDLEDWNMTAEDWKDLSTEERNDYIWDWAVSQGMDYGAHLKENKDEYI